jgi:hypothetical protein
MTAQSSVMAITSTGVIGTRGRDQLLVSLPASPSACPALLSEPGWRPADPLKPMAEGGKSHTKPPYFSSPGKLGVLDLRSDAVGAISPVLARRMQKRPPETRLHGGRRSRSAWRRYRRLAVRGNPDRRTGRVNRRGGCGSGSGCR